MRLGTLIDFFFECQNHQLKQSLKAKGTGHFPYLICHPLCVAQDHASVPLCCVLFLGCTIAAVLPQYCWSTGTSTGTSTVVLTPLLLHYCYTPDPLLVQY